MNSQSIVFHTNASPSSVALVLMILVQLRRYPDDRSFIIHSFVTNSLPFYLHSDRCADEIAVLDVKNIVDMVFSCCPLQCFECRAA